MRAREAELLRTHFGDKGHEDCPRGHSGQPRQHLHVPQYACISGTFITRGTSNVKGEHPTSRGRFQRQGDIFVVLACIAGMHTNALVMMR